MCVCLSFEFILICIGFYDLRCLLNIDKRNTLQILRLAGVKDLALTIASMAKNQSKQSAIQ